jgi:hypothetical protein
MLACSQLFDASRGQCKTSADCAARGHAELVCMKGLCMDESAVNGQNASDAGSAHDAGQLRDDAGHLVMPPHDAATPVEPDASADAGMSHGPADAGKHDAGMPALPDCPKASASLRFCDGFEDGFGPWTRDKDSDAELAITSADVARGTHALATATDKRGALWSEVLATFPGISHEPLWARAFIKARGDMSYDVITILRVETQDDSSDASEGIDVSLKDGKPRAELYAKGTGTDAQHDDTEDFPVDAWTCVELSLVPDLLDAVASLYIDGRLAVTFRNPLPTAPLERVRAGIFFSSDSQQAVSLGIDAVAVSTERIGCH